MERKRWIKETAPVWARLAGKPSHLDQVRSNTSVDDAEHLALDDQAARELSKRPDVRQVGLLKHLSLNMPTHRGIVQSFAVQAWEQTFARPGHQYARWCRRDGAVRRPPNRIS